MTKHPVLTTLWCWPILALTGCATSGVPEQAAGTALRQLSAYQAEVAAKVRAENDYYDTVLENTSRRIDGLQAAEQRRSFEAAAEKFARASDGKDAAALEPAIRAYVDSSRREWDATYAKYQQLLSQTEAKLTKGRQRLQVETAKIRKLKSDLKPLSESADRAEMLKLLVAFSREVKTKLDELEAKSDDAPK